MDEKWLTYEELGEALGITPASAKRLAIRRKWMKRPGNDGRARVAVPVERLAATRTVTPDAGDDADVEAGDDASDVAGDVSPVVGVLTRHIERLEEELAGTKVALAVVASERDAERLRATQIEALRAVLEVERDAARSARIVVENERDRWHAVATAPRGLAALVERFRRRAV